MSPPNTQTYADASRRLISHLKEESVPANDCHTFFPVGTFLPDLFPKCGYVSHLHVGSAANALPHFLLKTARLNFSSQEAAQFLPDNFL
jgi:hypothetical protein